MSNETVARYGRFISYVIWTVECLCAAIFAIGFEAIGIYGAAVITLILILGCFMFSNIRRKEGEDNSLFFLTFFMLSMGMSFYLSVKVNTVYLMILIYIMHWLVVVFFFDKSLSVYLAIFQLLALLVIFCMCKIAPNTFSMISSRQYIISIICIFLSSWIASSLIGILIEQQKQNDDQKKSLDDMLMVVEAICDETNESASNKAKFIAEMSHVIKNAIKPVKSLNAMIATETDIKKIREYSERIAESEKNLSIMAEEIITYTRLEQGDIHIIDKNYNFGRCIEKIITDVYEDIRTKNIALKVNVSDDMPLNMGGDYIYIDRAIRIVLSNAIKYTDRGSVSIDIYKGRGLYGDNKFQVCVDISDTGRGIREHDRENIFIPFYHVEEYNAKSVNGTGLGLYIAAKLTNLMGGNLSVSSEYGKGSTFHIELPQHKDIEGIKKAKENGTEEEKLYPYLEKVLSDVNLTVNTAEGNAPDGNTLKSDIKMAENFVSDGSVNAEGLPAIPGIDWDVAFGFLPSRAIVIKTLEELHKSGYENANVLRGFYEDILNEKEDGLAQYKIKVHAIKSNLKMVGAVELSDRAKDLEYAARDGLVDEIKSKTEGFINSYIDLIVSVGMIPEIAQRSIVTKKNFDKDEVIRLLDTVSQAMDDFDTELCDDSMKKLEEFEYSKDAQGLVKKLGSMVTNLDADGAKEVIGNIKGVIGE